MAKRIIDWNLNGVVLELGKYIDSDTAAEIKAKFDMSKIFPEFSNFNKVQKHTSVYGIKQLLADAGASEKGLAEKVVLAKAKWDLFASGKISDKRANATGAAENKKVVNSLKAKASSDVVSLESLQAKFFVDPDNFTEADQKKLDEFIIMKAEHLASEKEKEIERKKFEAKSK